MTGLDRDTSKSPDRTGVCCTGRCAPSQCETITGPSFSSLNKPDQERTPAYRDSSGSESPSGCLLCYFFRRLGGAIWGIPAETVRGRRVAGPFQLDQARGIAAEVHEVDRAAVVVVRIGDSGCDGTLVEPPGHVPLLGEAGHRFLEYGLLTPVAIGNVGGTPGLPELSPSAPQFEQERCAPSVRKARSRDGSPSPPRGGSIRSARSFNCSRAWHSQR